MKKLLLIMFFFKAGISFADDCKKISKEEAFNFSDLIFLGHVFEVSDSTYKIKVIESFKGYPQDTLVGVISRNVIPPIVGSIWLIYGQNLNDNRFLADVCSGSKSINWPHGTHDITFPTPPPPEVFKNPSQLFLLKQIIADKALNEFYYDVATLRAKRVEGENKLMKDKLDQIVQQYSLIENRLILMRWLMIASIVMSIGLVVLFFNKK